MDNIIKSHISKLSTHTEDTLREIERLYIPSVYKLDLERRFRPDYDFINRGFSKDSMLFVVHNFPGAATRIDKVFIDTLDNLVKDGTLVPVLIFNQGRFIRWSDIMIKSNRRYTYMCLKKGENKYIDNDDIQCIVLPKSGIYYVDNVSKDYIFNSPVNQSYKILFIFDAEGKHLTLSDLNSPTINGNDKFTLITLNTDEVREISSYRYEEFLTLPDKMTFSNIITKKTTISGDNVIYFDKGLLPKNAVAKERFVAGGEYNKFKITSNPSDSAEDKANPILVKVFHYPHLNSSVSIKSSIPNITDLDNLKKLQEGFNFKYDRKLSYEENLKNAVIYCMKYDSSLMNDVYKEVNNIKSLTYTGKHLKGLVDIHGMITMSTRKDKGDYNKIMIFHNGELYKDYHTISYIDKDFRFYLDTKFVQDNDIFEFLYIKNSYNIEKTIRLDSEIGDQYYIGRDIDLSDFKLFTTNLHPDHKKFNVEVSDEAQYEIPFIYRPLDLDIYEIQPKHPFYYDKKCTLVSNRQFRYFYKKIKYDECVDIKLSSSFKFCTDPNRYMVFINGRKIDNDNFKVTIVKYTRPFDAHSVYVNIPIKRGDRIEVFYLPDELHEVHVEKQIDASSGMIIVDKEKLSYNMDNELYLFFINGKKVRKEDIQAVGKNMVKILNSSSINNVSIVRHIEGIDILNKLFKYTDDITTEILDSISDYDFPYLMNDMYGTSNISDTEDKFNKDQVSMKSILHKLIRDYWNKPYITNGDEFIYDYYSDELDMDSDGNIIIPSMDGNKYNY